MITWNTRLLAVVGAAALSSAAWGVVGASASTDPPTAIPGHTVLTMVQVNPSIDPPSTGIIALEDLSGLGLGVVQLNDDGLYGDRIAGDNIFSLEITLPLGTKPGAYPVAFDVLDQQGREIQGTFSFFVGSPPCSADFNGDGALGTDADFEAFFACLGGYCCPTCGTVDIDGDGAIGTDADIEAFFRAIAGGPC
jgi:hypothetical protein